MNVGQIRIGFREDEIRGGHTQVSVFVGKQIGQRGHAGTITLRNEEWDELRVTLRDGMLQGAHKPYASLADVVDILPRLQPGYPDGEDDNEPTEPTAGDDNAA